MADSININIAVKSFAKVVQYSPTIASLVPFDLVIPAGTVDMEIPLTGMTSPEFLAVIGARGISIKRDASDNPLYADPMLMLSRSVNGLALTSVLVSNSDTEDHEILIIAAE